MGGEGKSKSTGSPEKPRPEGRAVAMPTPADWCWGSTCRRRCIPSAPDSPSTLPARADRVFKEQTKSRSSVPNKTSKNYQKLLKSSLSTAAATVTWRQMAPLSLSTLIFCTNHISTKIFFSQTSKWFPSEMQPFLNVSLRGWPIFTLLCKLELTADTYVCTHHWLSTQDLN